MCVFATSPAADKSAFVDPSLEAVVERLRTHPRMDAEPIAQFTAGWPAGQNHPQPWFPLDRGGRPADAGEQDDEPGTPIEHGACIRLRLPYQKARITDLRLNGRPVSPSETDGFVTWVARGCTYIQIGIPPARLVEDDLFVATCDYDPGETRKRWDSWR